uniref:Capsid protein n=1 Tax=Huanan hylidae astrovirus TaxID=2116330 RepID=A0A2P1GME8_9VIRU|nr:capsid protein [Huanan hylidae astrovirus]
MTGKKNQVLAQGSSQPSAAAGKKKQKRRKKKPQKPKTSVTAEVTRLRKEIKVVKERTDGPKTQRTFALTLDMGYIQPTQVDDLEKSLTVVINPLLMKATTVGGIATPLTLEACQYGLWKCASFEVRGIPLVGPSAVAGSSFVLTLTQDAGSTGAVSIDTLYQKPHLPLTLGKPFRWKIPSKSLLGPKQGWYYTDPDKEQTVTLGPRLEAWGFGVTNSTYQNAKWSSPLWRVTVRATYHFSSFSPKTELSVLEMSTVKDVEVLVQSDADGRAVATITGPSGANGPRAGSHTTSADIIWAVSEAAVKAAAAALPGWSWIVNGAWWFIKKLSGKELKNWLAANPGSNGNDIYYVYDSLDQARLNKPWRPPFGSETGVSWFADLQWYQLTPDRIRGTSSIESYPVPFGFPERAIADVIPESKQPWNLLIQTFIVQKAPRDWDFLWPDGTKIPFSKPSLIPLMRFSYSLGDYAWTIGSVHPNYATDAQIPNDLDQNIGDITSLALAMKKMLDSGAIQRTFWPCTIGEVNQTARKGVAIPGKLYLNKQGGLTGVDAVIGIFTGRDLTISTIKFQCTDKDYPVFLWVRDSEYIPDQTQANTEYQLASGFGRPHLFIPDDPPPSSVSRPVVTRTMPTIAEAPIEEESDIQTTDESDDEEDTDVELARTMESHIKTEIRNCLPVEQALKFNKCILCTTERMHDVRTCTLMRNPHIMMEDSPWSALVAHTTEDRQQWYIPILAELHGYRLRARNQAR